MATQVLQIRLSSKLKNEVANMQKESAFSSVSDLVKFSIAYYRWTNEKRKEGYRIYAIRQEGNDIDKVEVVFPS